MINVKQVTLCLYLTKNHAMKAYWRLEELDGGHWSPSYPGHFTTDKMMVGLAQNDYKKEMTDFCKVRV
jgi:hypothetical protein